MTVSELLQISKHEAEEAAAAKAAAEAAAAINTAEAATTEEQPVEMPVEGAPAQPVQEAPVQPVHDAPAQPVQEQITPQEEAAMHAASEEEPALKLEDFIIQ